MLTSSSVQDFTNLRLHMGPNLYSNSSDDEWGYFLFITLMLVFLFVFCRTVQNIFDHLCWLIRNHVAVRLKLVLLSEPVLSCDVVVISNTELRPSLAMYQSSCHKLVHTQLFPFYFSIDAVYKWPGGMTLITFMYHNSHIKSSLWPLWYLCCMSGGKTKGLKKLSGKRLLHLLARRTKAWNDWT